MDGREKLYHLRENYFSADNLLHAIIIAMSMDEADEMAEWIARHHDIHDFDEVEEEED